MSDWQLFTSPFGGEVGRRPGEGAFLLTASRKGPLTRPKRVDLSPEGRGKEGHIQ
jgi:hypothetical protein